MNRREAFKRLLGALSLPFAALLPQDRIRYLGKEDCKQMDAPLPPEPEYTTGYLQVVDTPSSWTSSTSTGNAFEKFGLTESGLGNHPEVIQMLVRIDQAISEDTVLTSPASGDSSSKPARTCP